MEQTILQQRFPKIELSYETDAHKKVLNSKYDICISIPTGKKYFAWFTYEPNCANDACYIVDKQGLRFTQTATNVKCHEQLYIETIVYGTLCEMPSVPVKFFVIEDISSYCGLSVKHMSFIDKLSYIEKFMTNTKFTMDEITFVLPYMTLIKNCDNVLSNPLFYDEMINKTAYVTHHVQFRSSTHVVPYLNHNYKKNVATVANATNPMNLINIERRDLDYRAAAQKREAVFLVMPDLEDDIYNLYCYDNTVSNSQTYLDVAYIGTRKESSYMNSLFRNIRENSNIDLGEESEDEEMFQNMSPDKYVDLTKKLKMRCIFNNKWRRWVPIAVVSDKNRVININELIRTKGPMDPTEKLYKGPMDPVVSNYNKLSRGPSDSTVYNRNKLSNNSNYNKLSKSPMDPTNKFSRVESAPRKFY